VFEWGLGIGNQIEVSKSSNFVGEAEIELDIWMQDANPVDEENLPKTSNNVKNAIESGEVDDDEFDETEGTAKFMKSLLKLANRASRQDLQLQAKVEELKERQSVQKTYYTKKFGKFHGDIPVFDEKKNEVARVTVTASYESFKQDNENVIVNEDDKSAAQKQLDARRNPYMKRTTEDEDITCMDYVSRPIAFVPLICHPHSR
jgi:hypothetical protein